MKLLSKNKFKKVYITDIAIKKVPLIEYKDLTKKQNLIMRHFARQVLIISKKYNNSNEVAITFDIKDDKVLKNYGISMGDERSVDVCADTLSNHLIRASKGCSIVIYHNHPSRQTFSLQDIVFFLLYQSINIMALVSNQGTVHYLYKDKKFDYNKAYDIIEEETDDLTNKSKKEMIYNATLRFLSRCTEAGILYY